MLKRIIFFSILLSFLGLASSESFQENVNVYFDLSLFHHDSLDTLPSKQLSKAISQGCITSGYPNCNDCDPCTTDGIHPTFSFACQHIPVSNYNQCNCINNGGTWNANCPSNLKEGHLSKAAAGCCVYPCSQPVDCNGVCGGNSVRDCAGVCGGNAVRDCNGDCNGNAVVDCAGVCGGNARRDCNGDCNGNAVVDCAGVCGGNSVRDCAGVCGGNASRDCNGDCNGNAVVDCAGVCGGNSVRDCAGVCGGNASRDCNGNCNGNAVVDCAGVCGGNSVRDCAGVCGGNATRDCNGECNGNAVVDCAGVCGGNSVRDCAGVCGGNATRDCNGECNGNAVVDCAGVCGGNSVRDCAGVCGGNATRDCNGECNGNAVVDCAGVCGGNSVRDCAGVCGGNATRDCNGECNGNAVVDCAGVCGGNSVRDCAGVCGGNATRDCNGECNGNAVVDCAGVCGGNSVRDCAGVCGGNATRDCNGECNGNAVVDCAGVCGGNSVRDACGVCDGNGPNPITGCCPDENIPSGHCDCQGTQPNDSCDDNDPCTENDVLQLLCECKGTPIVNPALTNPGQKICLDAQPFEISVNPSGGEFSGEGITEGLFDPSINGIGTYTITYNLTTSSGCDQSLSFPIKVVNCDTTQTCDGVQIGESCNDNDSLTINDLIKVNCLCQGTSLVDEPDDLVGLPDTICFSDLPYTTEPALLGGDHNLQPQTLNQDNYVAGETYIIRSFYSDQANGIWIEDYDTITITGHNFDLSRDLLGLPNIIESCDGTFNQSVFPTEGSNMQYEVTLNGNIVQTGEGENGLNIENNGFGTYEINGTIDGCSVTKSFTVVEGNCPTCTLGSPCSEDPCMIGGRFDKDCNCVGGVELEEDDDGDGVPNCEDICPGFDDKKDDNGDGKPDDCYDCLTESTVGQPCDDGDICTVNDKYDQNCQCKGEKQRIYVDIIPNDLTLCVGESYRAPGVDTVWNDLWEFDKDGWLKPRITRRVQQRYVCLYTYNEDGCKVEEHQFINIIDCPCEDEEDISKGCDDGDPCTILDKYNKNCECEGILDPRDSDGDGVVDECDVCNNYDDTKDLNENGVPDDCEECDNEIGTPCDDNDPCTYYDEYINPCTCSGIFKLPEDSIILAPKAICLEEGGIQLNAIYPDGNWIGSHIDTNGLFTPTDSGRYVICYEFEATDCSTIKRSFCTDIEVKGHRLVTINTPYDTVCSDALSFSILASISNGVFSGSGMETLSGLFNPNEAESGWNTITYTLESDECTQISEIQIFVDPCMIGGCTDTLAQNYNAEATVSDTCIYCADFTFDTIGLYVLCSGETQTIMAPTSRATSTISWVNQSNNEVVSNSSSLEWTAPLDTDYGQSDHFTVTATDQFGCSIGQTVTLVYIPTPTVSQSVNNGNCTSESSIVFTLNRDYGNEELEISLDGGSTYEMIEEQDSGTYIMPMYTSGTYTPIVRWKDDETTNRCFEVTMESITIDSISSSCDDPDCHSPQNVSALPFLDVFDCQIGHIIMSATGENLEYSLDGQLFQTSNSFTNLNRGIYDVTIRNGVTKCETTVKVILDGECPSNCDATEILVEVSHIDTCENETTGCIEMSVNAEGYEYSMDGINFSSNGLFCDLHQGAYAHIARKIDGTCTITSEGSINFTGECHDCSSITPLSIEGDSIGCINDSFTLMVDGEYDEGTLSWSLPAGQAGTGATTRTITVSESGTYSVSATLNGCELSSSFKVVQSPFECDSTCIPNAITIISSPNGFGYGSSSHIENTRITENGLVIRPQMNNGSAELALLFSSTPSDFSFGVTIGGHSYGLNIDNIASFIHPNVTEGCNPITPDGTSSIGQGDILRIRVEGSVVSIWLNGDMLYAEDIGSAGTLEHFFITEGDNPFLEATIGLDEEGCPDGLEDRPISELPPPIEPCEEDECNIPLSIQIVAQDTCNGTLGSIIVSSDSVGVSYSLDGISYSESGSFDNLQAGTYTLHSQKDTCNSSTEVIIGQSDSCLTCSDGILNGDETNIDCGGTKCPECIIGCTDPQSITYNSAVNISDPDSCRYCDDITINLQLPAVICEGGTTTITADISPNDTPYDIEWGDGFTGSSLTFDNTPGQHIFTITASDSYGCNVTISDTVEVAAQPSIYIDGGSGGCDGSEVTLTIYGEYDANTVLWNLPAGQAGTGETSASIQGIPGNTYSVTASYDGCEATATHELTLFTTDDTEETNQDCYDGLDNDCDGLIDCDDPDCSDLLICDEDCELQVVIFEAIDGRLHVDGQSHFDNGRIRPDGFTIRTRTITSDFNFVLDFGSGSVTDLPITIDILQNGQSTGIGFDPNGYSSQPIVCKQEGLDDDRGKLYVSSSDGNVAIWDNDQIFAQQESTLSNPEIVFNIAPGANFTATITFAEDGCITPNNPELPTAADTCANPDFPLEEFCVDGIDNDLDGLVDCDDPDCSEFCPPTIFIPECEVLAADDGAYGSVVQLIMHGGYSDFNVMLPGFDTFRVRDDNTLIGGLPCGQHDVFIQNRYDSSIIEMCQLDIPIQLKTIYEVTRGECLTFNIDESCLGLDLTDAECIVWSPPHLFEDASQLNTTICPGDDSTRVVILVIDDDGNIGDSLPIDIIVIDPPLDECNDGLDNDGDGGIDGGDIDCSLDLDNLLVSNEFVEELRRDILFLNEEYDFLNHMLRKYGTPNWKKSLLINDQFALIPFEREGEYYTTAYISYLKYNDDPNLVIVKRDLIKRAIFAGKDLIDEISLHDAVLGFKELDRKVFKTQDPIFESWLKDIDNEPDTPEDDYVCIPVCFPECIESTYTRGTETIYIPNPAHRDDCAECRPVNPTIGIVEPTLVETCVEWGEKCILFCRKNGTGPIIVINPPEIEPGFPNTNPLDGLSPRFRNDYIECLRTDISDPLERPAICDELHDIIQCDPYGLGHLNHVSLLEDLQDITNDCVNGEEGMLPQVRDFINNTRAFCGDIYDGPKFPSTENHPTTPRNPGVALAEEYVSYAMLFPENPISFEDYATLREFMLEKDISPSLALNIIKSNNDCEKCEKSFGEDCISEFEDTYEFVKDVADLDPDQMECLISAEQLNASEDFLNKHGATSNSDDECSSANIAKAVVNSLADLRCDPSSSDLINDLESFDADSGDPLNEILIDQLTSMMEEILIELIPGGSLITIGPELIQNFEKGNYLDAMFNILDIALQEGKRLNPALQCANLANKTVKTSKAVARFMKVFNQLREFGDRNVQKLYKFLKEKMGKNLYKLMMRVPGYPNQAEFDFDADPLTFFEELVKEFDANGEIRPDESGNGWIFTFEVEGQHYYLSLHQSTVGRIGDWTISIGFYNSITNKRDSRKPNFKFTFIPG